jgi:hypothetical protein
MQSLSEYAFLYAGKNDGAVENPVKNLLKQGFFKMGTSAR